MILVLNLKTFSIGIVIEIEIIGTGIDKSIVIFLIIKWPLKGKSGTWRLSLRTEMEDFDGGIVVIFHSFKATNKNQQLNDNCTLIRPHGALPLDSRLQSIRDSRFLFFQFRFRLRDHFTSSFGSDSDSGTT